MNAADILRRNHVFLKQKLDVINCLDYLFQEGTITKHEYDTCQSHQCGADKCQNLLDLLLRKDETGYKTFCAILEKTGQSFVKERLDNTSTECGALSLLYVRRDEIERKQKETVDVLQSRIAALTHELGQTTKDITDVVENNKRALKELDTEHQAVLRTEREKLQTRISHLEEQLRKESREKLQAERLYKETRVKLQTLENDTLGLQKEIRELQEKYAAVTTSFQQEIKRTRMETGSNLCKVENESCCVCHTPLTGGDDAFILLCLHNLCQTCWNSDQDWTELQCSRCNRVSRKEQIKIDTARWNKHSLETMKTTMKCTYNVGHNHEAAVIYCRGCEQSLCQTCQTLHQQTTTCIQHETYVIEDLGSIPAQKLLRKSSCLNHDSHVVELYDTDCQVPVCLICTQDDHKGHQMITIDKAYVWAQSSLDEVAANLQAKSDEVEKRIADVKDHRETFDNKEETLRRETTAIREKLVLMLLRREKNLFRTITESFEESRRTLTEKLHQLYDMQGSLETTAQFIEKIKHYCGQSDLLDVKGLVEAKARLDLSMELPTDDTRDTRVEISLQGLRALEHQIQSFLCLYSLADWSYQEAVPDDVLTPQEFQGRIRQLEGDVTELSAKLLQCELDLHESERAKLSETMLAQEEHRKQLQEKSNCLREIHELRTIIRQKEENIQLERRNSCHLRTRCTDMEEKVHQQREKIKSVELDGMEKLQSAQTEIDRLRKSYSQLEQTLDQTVVCVGRHRGDADRCLVTCPKFSFSAERLNPTIGRIIEGCLLTSSTSDDQVPYTGVGTRPFRRYCGTVSSTTVFPAPCRLHEHPIFWELDASVDLNRELLYSNIVFETGVAEEDSADRSSLTYRGSSAWCIILKSCTKHKSICTQIWKQGRLVSCYSDTLPNRRGASVKLRYGGVLDDQRGKFAFLDFTRDIILGCFDLRDTVPLVLMFGFPPKPDNSTIQMKLTSPRKLDMTSEKKSLISRALLQMQ